jgi:hypothetical protein
VYGLATSGPVSGFTLTDCGSTAGFVLNQGERGQSGTLLYSTATGQPIGVFPGMTYPSPDHHPRGVCVPVPHLDELVHTYPISSTGPTFVPFLSEKEIVPLPLSFDSSLGCWLLQAGPMKYSGVVVNDHHDYMGIREAEYKKVALANMQLQ